MTTAAYKLTYFPVKALAEPIRFLLSYGDIKFEDNRLPKDKWPEHKNNMPFGQVPVLEVNGKLAYQSVAIARYLAKQVNLVGSDDWENLEIDAMVDTITDLRSKIGNYNMETDETKKEALLKTLMEETIPFYLNKFDSLVTDKYLCLGKLTWADIYFVGTLDYCNGVMKNDLIANYPNLLKVRENVLSIENIKSWIEKRPESEY